MSRTGSRKVKESFGRSMKIAKGGMNSKNENLHGKTTKTEGRWEIRRRSKTRSRMSGEVPQHR
jgi:hypothetical protein